MYEYLLDSRISLYTFYLICYDRYNNQLQIIKKVGGHMPTGLEVTKVALDDFKKIQEYMLLAKKENATETYAKLKDEYLTIKALLQVSGVNLTDIDKIKE